MSANAAAEPLYKQAMTHLAAERHAEALPLFEQAVALDPESVPARLHLGVTLMAMCESEAALPHIEWVVAREQKDEMAWRALGKVYYDRGDYDRAIEFFDRAEHVAPDPAQARYFRGMTLMLQGDFLNGWPLYDERIAIPRFGHRHMPKPRWHGEPLRGKRLLVLSEQGFGDMLQFFRFIRDLEALDGDVIVEVPADMAPLLSTFRTRAHILPITKLGVPNVEFDYYCALLSVPRWLGTTVDTIPAPVPYIMPEASEVTRWGQRFDFEGFKVGCVWQGRPTHPQDKLRSHKPEPFAELGTIPGVKLVSLQHLRPIDRNWPHLYHSFERDMGRVQLTYADTAAIIANLDLVIAVDTSVAHLAGAMGKPVWTLLPFAPDFRWLLDRNDTPWYPTMRLFRQPTPGDWDSVFVEVRRELEKLVARHTA